MNVLVRCLAVSVGFVAFSTGCLASETLYYCYDAQGRLTRVQHVACSTVDALRTYTFDNADNRTNVTVVKASSRVVVVPLNGFTVIPIPDP